MPPLIRIAAMSAAHSHASSSPVTCKQTSQTTAAVKPYQPSATDYKEAGNKLCAQHRFEEAIEYYSKAIACNREVPVFFSNRALCHLKLKQWSQAVADCRRCLELEKNSIKAHFYLGQALAETGLYEDALKHLQRAHELAKEKQMNFGDDIAYQIRLVKRHLHNKREASAYESENELQTYLVALIRKDKEERLAELRGRLEVIRSGASASQPQDSSWSLDNGEASSSLPQPEHHQLHHQAGSSSEESQLEARQAEIVNQCDLYRERLLELIDCVKQQRRKREIPDYLCGKISFELMHDPVITPFGITYDRPDIEEHLRRVGHFDPITRQPLTSNQLISNLAMKEVLDAYLNENEWALYS